MPKVLFAIAPKTHLLDLCGPAHTFYEAGEFGLPFDLVYAAISKEKLELSSAGLSFSKLEDFEDHELGSEDFIFIPGAQIDSISEESFVTKHKDFFNWLNRQYKQGANLCGVCTGAFIIASSGLLNGKNCTTHWDYLERLQRFHPLLKVLKNRLIVKDERIYTSAGVSSGIDLSLYILEQFYDLNLVAKVSKEMVYPLRRNEDDPQLNVFLQHRNHLDNRIHTVQDFIMNNLSQSNRGHELAELVNMSTRNLSRLFKQKTTLTIGQYLEKVRVETAISLLKDGAKVKATAEACGLKSTNQLRNLLKKHKGALPSELTSSK
ncbi:MAG: DJ-1/PfpI family protein [Saprospiraceae bacterium]|nr:DJ-1/PfpI family protein [Saprospiraceae bacterium]